MPNVPHPNSSPCSSYSSLAPVPTLLGIFSALSLLPSSHIMNKVRSFPALLPATPSDHTTELAPPSSSSPIQVAALPHLDREQDAHDLAFMQRLSAPVDVVHPRHWRSCREDQRSRRIIQSKSRRRKVKDELETEAAEGIVSSEEEDDEEEEEEEEGEQSVAEEKKERLPPHEQLAREWAASTSCGGAAFSLCQGVGRTLKGRDLCRVRNAILKQTGFIS